MDQDKRQSLRKALTSSGKLTRDGKRPAQIETINVAQEGIAISAHEKIVEGALYKIGFTLPLDGASHDLVVRANAVFCVYAGQSIYKAGLKFVEVDADAAELISKFLSVERPPVAAASGSSV
jgi:hypothetical protein